MSGDGSVGNVMIEKDYRGYQQAKTLNFNIFVDNLIFIRIRKDFINIVKMYDKDFKQYPIYKKVVSFKFKKYNEMITVLPKYF